MPELLQRDNVPGVAIGIIENGKITGLYFYGAADKASGEPVRENTTFKAGSVSKTLTA